MNRFCGDCAWFNTCFWLISRQATDTDCDWSPSRFREKTTTLPANPIEYVPGEDKGLENEN